MCTVLLPPGDNPIAVNKYIIIYISRVSTNARDNQGWSKRNIGTVFREAVNTIF